MRRGAKKGTPQPTKKGNTNAKKPDIIEYNPNKKTRKRSSTKLYNSELPDGPIEYNPNKTVRGRRSTKKPYYLPTNTEQDEKEFFNLMGITAATNPNYPPAAMGELYYNPTPPTRYSNVSPTTEEILDTLQGIESPIHTPKQMYIPPNNEDYINLIEFDRNSLPSSLESTPVKLKRKRTTLKSEGGLKNHCKKCKKICTRKVCPGKMYCICKHNCCKKTRKRISKKRNTKKRGKR